MHLFPYNWTLKDAVFVKDKGTVFSCFACGGGSTMGYKLAGFDVIGCNEIDPKMMAAYRINHSPRYSYLEPIQTFKLRTDLPDELYHLDILDGSPPCSSFSMAGNREKDWGKEKKFREGQAKQVLDNLFFDFIDLAKKLQPKVVIAENVKGLLLAGAQKYVAEILKQFNDAGYYVDYTLLDASKMGVPQRRKRVFFYAIRKDLYQGKFTDLFGTRPEVKLEFTEPGVLFQEVQEDIENREKVKGLYVDYWAKCDHTGRAKTDKGNTFGFLYRAKPNLPLATILATDNCIAIDQRPEKLSSTEILKCGSFPYDYNLLENLAQYVVGMSVPPIMMAQIATEIYGQWLKNLQK